jgi:aminoglycoside phosphotransferase (APT) family kinase protein
VPGDVVARGTRSLIHAYGRDAVIKIPNADTPESWIHFEAEYAEAARGSGAPVPRLLGMELIGGRAASVWERVRGPSLWHEIADRPERSARYGAQLADVHEELFSLVPPVTLPSQRDRFTTKIRLTAARIDRSHAEALDLLPAAHGPARLCHGDLHPSNIILSPRGPVIVDWFDASRGDPIADVARTWVILLADGADAPPHLPGADRATLERLTAAYLARLREHREIDDGLLARWEAVNAVARMAEGVRRDALLGVWTRFHDQAAVHAAAN